MTVRPSNSTALYCTCDGFFAVTFCDDAGLLCLSSVTLCYADKEIKIFPGQLVATVAARRPHLVQGMTIVPAVAGEHTNQRQLRQASQTPFVLHVVSGRVAETLALPGRLRVAL